MLKILRKKGVAKKILWVIAVIIVISFGFFGTAYLLSYMDKSNYVGEIFEKKISADQFRRSYDHTRIQTMIHFGDSYNKIRQFINLEAETWDRLILLKEAERRNIKITDKEVIEAINQYVFFKRDGHFDMLLYNNILRNILRVKPTEFEASVRDNLKISRLFEQETSSIDIKEEEIFQAFKLQNEKIQISYILIPFEQFKNAVSFTEEEALEYFTNNQKEFRVPVSFDIEYLSLDLPKEETAEKTPEAAKEAQQLLEQKAWDIHEALLKNPDFQNIAQEYALEVKTTGFFSLEQPNLSLGWPFAVYNTIVQLKPGEISPPQETPQGYLILKIKEKKDSYLPDYVQAKEDAKEALLKEKAKGIAFTKSQEYLQTIKKASLDNPSQSFSDIAKTFNLEIFQTPVFNRGQYLPSLGLAKDFQETAFHLTDQNAISEPVETAHGYCILHRDSYFPADQQQFTQEKGNLQTMLLNEKKNGVFNDFLTRLRLKANLTDYNLKTKTTR